MLLQWLRLCMFMFTVKSVRIRRHADASVNSSLQWAPKELSLKQEATNQKHPFPLYQDTRHVTEYWEAQEARATQPQHLRASHPRQKQWE